MRSFLAWTLLLSLSAAAGTVSADDHLAYAKVRAKQVKGTYTGPLKIEYCCACGGQYVLQMVVKQKKNKALQAVLSYGPSKKRSISTKLMKDGQFQAVFSWSVSGERQWTTVTLAGITPTSAAAVQQEVLFFGDGESCSSSLSGTVSHSGGGRR